MGEPLAGRMVENKVVPEMEIFEAGMVAAAKMLIEEGTLKFPFYYNFALGLTGLPPLIPEVFFIWHPCCRQGLPGAWSTTACRNFALLATAIGLGASMVRVGFEDSVRYAPGKIAKTNLALVEKLVSLVQQIGYEVASPDEAREILSINE